MMQSKAHYRPEIDGLRAISVLSVIFFHAHFPGFSGGFVGVDIFYVISGFLITCIIAKETDSGAFSLKRFYERRVRRILPALTVVLIACLPAAWWLMMPQEFADFGRSLVAVILFMANIFFARGTDYFGPATAMKPLIHTWSLSVEEQFYFVFPLLFVLLKNIGRRFMIAVLFVLFVASLSLAQLNSTQNPVGAFYYPHMRAWELLFGGLLALFAHRFPTERSAFVECGSLAGLILVFVSITMFDETAPVPGLLGLIPLSGAALIIAFGRPETLTGKLLSSRLAVFVGLLSYSAYLWHQPVFAFARMKYYWGVSPLLAVGLCVLTFVLAWLTWRFVEVPARDRERISTGLLLLAVGGASVALLLCGFVLRGQGGFPSRVPHQAVFIEADAQKAMLQLWRCESSDERPFDPDRLCRTRGSRGNVAVWGDSHAMALSVGLGPALTLYDYGSINYSSSSCLPILGAGWFPSIRKCDQERQRVLQSIVDDASIKIVVMAGRWPLITEHKSFDNGEGGVELTSKLKAVFARPYSEMPDPALAAMKATLAVLKQGGKKVVLVGAVPEVGWNVPAMQARRIMNSDNARLTISTRVDVFKQRTRPAAALLRSAATGAPNLIQFEPATVLCDTVIPGRCAAENGTTALYFDDNHLNPEGSRLVADALVKRIASAGWLGGASASRPTQKR